MTGERAVACGPLGRRLLAAFVLVALSSVVVLTAAALIGTDRGLAAAERAGRQQATGRAADAAAAAYRAAGGWERADLSAVQALADAAGARVVVRDASGAMVWPGQAPTGSGPGVRGQHASASPVTAGGGTDTAPVVVDGRTVGTATLAFGPAPAAGGRTVAWEWVAAAGVVALLLALAVSGYVARRLSAPLVAVTRAARAFAAGDRAVRTRLDAPGELGDLAGAVDAMADQVVAAERVRRRLSADVAHELRTPLAALQAGLEELRDGLAEPDPARLASMHDQSLRLGRVVQDLADLSAAESAALSLDLAEADLTGIVAAALDGQEPRLRAAGLTVLRDWDGPVPVRADADRMHQAVANLLTNAGRYCRPGDSVRVHVGTGDGYALVEVADTGPGIAPAELPHVFDRLWRGRAGRDVAGAGIGLAVTRELVEAHGGTVTAASRPGHGATFTVRLPLVRPTGR